jgi:dTDP-L-rhamnose 4-epimerase
MKKILVTGGAGFIGQRLSIALIHAGHYVRILDNFSIQVHSSNVLPEIITKNSEVISTDIRNRDALKKAISDIDTVIHLAAETGTGQSMYEIERYFSVNVQGTATLLDLLQNDSCGKSVQSIVVASSRAIYGEGAYNCNEHGTVYPEQRTREALTAAQFEPRCPYCGKPIGLLSTAENAPFKPMSVYGLTKQVQEQSVLLYARTRGINGFGLRYQNVYGPGQSLKNPYTGILAVFSNLARQNELIEIYEDGFESRDFIYIDDVVSATVKSALFDGKYIGAINVGSGVATSVMSVAQTIKNYFSSSSEIRVSGAFRVGDIRHNIADISLAHKVLGFVPRVSFPQGINGFLSWAENQPMHDKAAYAQSVDELSSKNLMGSAKHKSS